MNIQKTGLTDVYTRLDRKIRILRNANEYNPNYVSQARVDTYLMLNNMSHQMATIHALFWREPEEFDSNTSVRYSLRPMNFLKLVNIAKEFTRRFSTPRTRFDLGLLMDRWQAYKEHYDKWRSDRVKSRQRAKHKQKVKKYNESHRYWYINVDFGGDVIEEHMILTGRGGLRVHGTTSIDDALRTAFGDSWQDVISRALSCNVRLVVVEREWEATRHARMLFEEVE